MSNTRESSRLVVIGFFLGLAVAIGALQLHDGYVDAALKLHDRQADSLTKKLLQQARQIRADSIEQARLSHIADSASAVARRALDRARVQFVVQPDPAPPTPTSGDTTAYVLVQRPADLVPFRVPQFMVDELLAQEQRLAAVTRAWQAEQAARLFADTTVIPDLRRQLEESGQLLKLERQRVADRDAKLEGQARRRRLERVAEGGVLLLILLAAR